jgi:hypothetical protein
MRIAIVAAMAALLLVVPTAAPAAEQLAGITSDNHLVLFRSDSPGNVQLAVPITGLQRAERLIGIDRRPANDRIYAIGSSNRVYIINVATGIATRVNSPFSPGINGSTFAFALNPVTDEFRLLSDRGQDLRIFAPTGQVSGSDPPFVYAADDSNAGNAPALRAITFSNPFPGASTATLYGIDPVRDALVQNPDNSATLRTLGSLGIDATVARGFDIAFDGTAYAALRTADARGPMLYTVDLTTGAVTPTTKNPDEALIATRTSSTATRSTLVSAIVTLGQVPDDVTKPRVGLGLSSASEKVLIANGLLLTVSCNEACSLAATLRLGAANVARAERSIIASAGTTTLLLRLPKAARDQLAKPGPSSLDVRLVATDAAGNVTTLSRAFRTTEP